MSPAQAAVRKAIVSCQKSQVSFYLFYYFFFFERQFPAMNILVLPFPVLNGSSRP